ncbi:hypothetical protein NP493_217g03019 [Ridgeia piscesae]|uniref:Rieske domain-containing protein n=1 Tax=Ridgeia piscesae TaxID=27915 RepID=A0AAD9UDY8_RIDPI|nr:hypothetical protein NP493_217g03019 [Ridgeia piscesae]
MNHNVDFLVGGSTSSEGEGAQKQRGEIKCLPKEEVSVDGIVCKVDDMKDGEMKVYDVGDGRVLLIRDKGNFHAIGAKCTHYGAPLVNGALCNGRVRCPWHGACFDIKTGDIEDFPGLDSLPRFDVEIVEGSVKIHGTEALSSNRRVKQMECGSPEDDRTFLLVGGGYASVACAETLRQEGYKGKIIIMTNEPFLPYDRPKLSKACNATANDILLRKPEFYSVYDIEILVNKKAVSVDTMLRSVSFEDGTISTYDKLMIATGGNARTLDKLEGHDLENITPLRQLHEAHLVAERGKGKRVVVIGTSFIGLEVASYLIGKATSVTLVGLMPEPLQPILGTKVGGMVRKLFEDKGAKFVFGSSPARFLGSGKKITEVELENGTKLPADLCVIGIGVQPATEFLKEGSIALSQNGYIMVDKSMKTSRDDVYAAGDLTEFPLFMAGDAKVNIQHWQMAGQQGRIAALNMLGKDTEIRSVPFFWTVFFGKSLRYTGYGVGHDDIIIQGDLEGMKFIAYYTKGDYVVAVASLNFDPIVAQAAEMFNAGKTITKAEVSG